VRERRNVAVPRLIVRQCLQSLAHLLAEVRLAGQQEARQRDHQVSGIGLGITPTRSPRQASERTLGVVLEH
jgi:hypothetical protein